MNKVLQATYRDGSLVLDEKLDTSLEGKKLKLILVEEDFLGEDLSSTSEADVEECKRDFMEWAKQYSAKLPPNYHFNREEAHER